MMLYANPYGREAIINVTKHAGLRHIVRRVSPRERSSLVQGTMSLDMVWTEPARE